MDHGHGWEGYLAVRMEKEKEVVIIDLARKGLADWPEDSFQKANAVSLEGYQNKFSDIPSTITQLKSLTRLVLWMNEIKSLPEELGKLRKLKVCNN